VNSRAVQQQTQYQCSEAVLAAVNTPTIAYGWDHIVRRYTAIISDNL